MLYSILSLLTSSVRNVCPVIETISMCVMASLALIVTISDAGLGYTLMLLAISSMPVIVAIAVSDASDVPPFVQLVMM